MPRQTERVSCSDYLYNSKKCVDVVKKFCNLALVASGKNYPLHASHQKKTHHLSGQQIKHFVNHLLVKCKHNIEIFANLIDDQKMYQVHDHIGQKIEDVKKKREQSIGEEKH